MQIGCIARRKRHARITIVIRAAAVFKELGRISLNKEAPVKKK
jgi:hypothetical protein